MIEIDILNFEKFVLDLNKETAFIENCKIIVFIMFKRHDKINHVMCFKKSIIIPPHTQQSIQIHHLNLLKNRNFIFESNDTNVNLYIYVFNADTLKILIQNDENKSVKIIKNFRLK